MDDVFRQKEFSGTGSISDKAGVVIGEIALVAGSDAAKATIKEGGVGGTVVLTLVAPANSADVRHTPRIINQPYIATLTGTGPVVDVTF